MKLFVVGVGSPRIRCKQNAKPEGGPNGFIVVLC